MEAELIERAISEIENPTLESTKEYLALHSVSTHYDTPLVERIDCDSFEFTNAVYFSIDGEGFYMVVRFSKDLNQLVGVEIENGNMICITATSENLNFDHLSETTPSFSWKGWSKGDIMPNNKSKYYYSRVTYGPIKSKAYDLETAIKLLLVELEKDVVGVQNLASKSDACISICRYLYVSANICFQIGSETIARINRLNLNIEIEQYVHGNALPEEEY